MDSSVKIKGDQKWPPFFMPPLGFFYEKYFLPSSNIKQTAVKIRPDQP